jgi:hemerythrin-like metal-binding protein
LALIDSTTTQFTYEEELLARAGYPDSAVHKKEHADLIKHIQVIRRDDETDGPRAVTIPVMSFFANWVTSHILGTDMLYRPYLVAKGVR